MSPIKSFWLFLPIILCVAAGLPAPAIAQAGEAVAVWDLEDLTPVPSAATDLGELLSAAVIETFKESGSYTVVERQRLLLVLEELNLSTTKMVSESTRLEIGRLIGARLMVFGSYMVISDTMRMDLRKVEVETGRVLKAASRTTIGSDIVEWIQKAREAAKELL